MKENPLKKFGELGIGAKCIASQMWCEQKTEFALIHGIELTEAMARGKERHKELHEEIAELIPVKTETIEDVLSLKLHNMFVGLMRLPKEGMTREFSIFGKINKIFINGQIDQLDFDGKNIIISDRKTRNSPTRPSFQQLVPDEFQLKIYYKLLTDIKNGIFTVNDLLKFYNLNKSARVSKGFEKEMKDIGSSIQPKLYEIADLVFSLIKKLPKISTNMKLVYEFQPTQEIVCSHNFSFDNPKFIRDFSFLEKYWLGERKALPVGESNRWKCNFCNFKGKCPEWL